MGFRIGTTNLNGRGTVTTDTARKWERPADWISLPELSNGDEKICILTMVLETGISYVSLLCQITGGTEYQVDWGDGNVTTHGTNTQADHEYNFADIDASTEITYKGLTFRQAIITITPVSGTLFLFYGDRKPPSVSAPNPGSTFLHLDMVLASQTLYRFSVGQENPNTMSCPYLERFRWIGDSSSLTFTYSAFGGCDSLEVVEIPDTSNLTGWERFFWGCKNLTRVPHFDTSSATSFRNMFYYCTSLKYIPPFNTSNITTNGFEGMFTFCYSLEHLDGWEFYGNNYTTTQNMFYTCNSLLRVPNTFNTSNVTNANNMFYLCTNLKTFPDLDLRNVTAMANFMLSVSTLTFPVFQMPVANSTSTSMFFGKISVIPALDLSAFTSFASNAFYGQYIRRFEAYGMRYSFSLTNSLMDRAALVELFNNLGTAVGAQTLTITGSVGVPDLTAGDLAIATGKGWTVAT